MENKKVLTRKSFIKLIGALGISAFIGTNVVKCTDNRERIGKWIKTGNKVVKPEGTHLVWEIIDLQDASNCNIDDLKGSIEVPYGYYVLDVQTIEEGNSLVKRTKRVKYDMLNYIDVEVDEYINEQTQEYGYPKPGTALITEFKQESQKVKYKRI